MNDPLISEYLPVLRGHIIRRYASITRRTNCLLDIDDLIQIGSIELIDLVSKWDGFLQREGKSRDGTGGLFWKFLEHRIKQAVIKYFQRVAHADRAPDSSVDEIGASPEHFPPDVRTRLNVIDPYSITLNDIVDFFSTMPQQDKVRIALRYFDELAYEQIADVLSAPVKSTKNLTSVSIARLRAFARNQFLEVLEDIPRRVPLAWEPPESLLTYLDARYRMDFAEYLGYVTICFRADVSYLVDMLSHRFMPPGTMAMGLTSEQRTQVDEMMGAGISMREISRQLDVSYGTVVVQSTRQAS